MIDPISAILTYLCLAVVMIFAMPILLFLAIGISAYINEMLPYVSEWYMEQWRRVLDLWRR